MVSCWQFIKSTFLTLSLPLKFDTHTQCWWLFYGTGGEQCQLKRETIKFNLNKDKEHTKFRIFTEKKRSNSGVKSVNSHALRLLHLLDVRIYFELCAVTCFKMARLPKRISAQAVVKKVRFSLPLDSASDEDIEEEVQEKQPNVSDKKKPTEPKKDESKVHGTAKYINGTLNFCRNDYKPTAVEPKSPPKKEKKAKKLKDIINVTTFPRSALASNSQRPIESPVCSDYWTKAFNGCKIIYENPANHPASPVKSAKKARRRTRIRACTTILFSPTKCIRRSACFRNGNKKKFQRLPNVLQVPPPHSTPRRLRTKFGGRNHFVKFFTKTKIGSQTKKISMQVILLNRNHLKFVEHSICYSHLLGN